MDDGWLQRKWYVGSPVAVVSVSHNAANALGIFTPAITLVLFAIISRDRSGGRLDAGTAFTTIAVLTMVTHPANMLMTIWPRAMACTANFERIQRYLLDSFRQDNRLDIKDTLLETPLLETEDDNPCYALVANTISVQYPSSSKPILQNINFKVEARSFWIFSGRVGSGKTTLAQVILGEVPPVSGSIAVSTRRIGFCTQTPWLPSLSIKEVICADGDSDPEWYKTVVYACGLEHDLDRFPHGDETLIGSRGLKLSGGQRQRVVSWQIFPHPRILLKHCKALARAVYARCDILVLDDPFTALDGATEDHVVQNLLKPTGLLRQNGITLILMTNNGKRSFYRF
jgi:ATP-binding cassette subfamily C (CFTR/MRP) protein 1